MEKLQKALQKAREQRTGAVIATPAASNRSGSPAGLAELWEALVPHDPREKDLLRNRVVTLHPRPEATPFDVLRTKVLLQMRKNGWRRLAITSPTAGCGKSTLACNLAAGLSRQPDIRAMLIELDLRRPAVARLLAASPAHDVTAMLTGQVPFGDQAMRLRTNVAVSMAREPSSDPTRYMLSQETEARLKEIEERYRPDIVAFDLPPLLVGDDTRAFLSSVDCALLVARAEKTTVAQIDACEREIADHTNVLGVVLNQCRFAGESSGAEGYGEY